MTEHGVPAADASPGGGAAAAEATDLAKRFWEGYLRFEPWVGTEIGDERYDDRLPDPSDEGQAEKREFLASIRAELERLVADALDVELRTALAVIDAGTRREIDAIDRRVSRLDAVSHIFGPGNLVAELGSIQRADTPERVERYVRRLEALGPFLARIDRLAEQGIAEGLVAPALVVDRCIGQVERLLAIEPSESPGMTPVPETDADARERVAAALREHVWPAYHGYLEALRRYRPLARDSIGLRELPDGDAIYDSLVLGYTTLPLPAQEVHDIGRRELDAIQEERLQVARSLGFDDVESALRAHEGAGRNIATSREQFLEVVRAQVERSWEAAPGFFGRVPRDNCEVKPVEEFREDDMPGAYYFPPTADGSRPGVYYVNTGHLEGRPLHATATTSFHEANPGHHFQISIEQEFTERLPVRRFGGMLVGASFVEGWGLYSERLADEMGLFLDDYERLGMLEADAFRAARLIVDTGIHALGWDRERSVRQMMATGSSRVDSEIEVDRYVAMPGQACAYKIGELEILRWRRDEERREGAGFSLRDFHDRILALGSLPLRTIEREIAAAAAARV